MSQWRGAFSLQINLKEAEKPGKKEGGSHREKGMGGGRGSETQNVSIHCRYI